MSKLVKSSHITIDKKKYVLNNDFFIPKPLEEKPKVVVEEEISEDKKKNLDDELRLMREEMLEEMKNQSDDIVGKAQDEKESILQNAYDQAGAITEQAKNEGYDEGFQAGVEKGYNEANAFIQETLALKEKYYKKYDNIKEESEADLTAIIIQTIEKILNKHIEEDYDLIQGLVETALEKTAFTSNLILRVSAEDYDHAITMKQYILSLTENVEDIEIKQDNALIKGSCIIDTNAGSVDSSIHTQFENVKNKFIELLQSE